MVPSTILRQSICTSKGSCPRRMERRPRAMAWLGGASMMALATVGEESTSPRPTRPSSVCRRMIRASCVPSARVSSASGSRRGIASTSVIFIGPPACCRSCPWLVGSDQRPLITTYYSLLDRSRGQALHKEALSSQVDRDDGQRRDQQAGHGDRHVEIEVRLKHGNADRQRLHGVVLQEHQRDQQLVPGP